MSGAAVMRAVAGEFVKLLFHERSDRGMTLEPYETRCLRRHDVHEILTTDEAEAPCGERIDRVGFLGFAEITTGGVVERGQAVVVGGRAIGRVLGFDSCHFPNHYNVIVACERLLTASSASVELGVPIHFEPRGP